jgi:hypothetical protein
MYHVQVKEENYTIYDKVGETSSKDTVTSFQNIWNTTL